MRKENQTQIRNVLYAILVLFVLSVCKLTASISVDLILSFFIFLVMFPLATTLERHGFKSWLATTVAVLVIIFVVAGMFMFILFTVDKLIRIIPAYSLKISFIDSKIVSFISRWHNVSQSDSILNILDINLSNSLLPVLRSFSSSAISVLKNAVVTILLSVFLLIERHTFIPKLSVFVPNENNPEKFSILFDRINKQVSKFLGMKFFLSFITALLFYVVLTLVGLDLPLLWSILAFILNFIPTFGSIIITGITILMALIQFFPNWTGIIIVAVGTITIQMVIGNIIDPRFQGTRLNLSPFVILVSLSIFGYIWGIIGMFLAVPIISILHIVFANMESTRNIAILMSSGSSIKRRLRAEGKKNKVNQDDEVLFPQINFSEFHNGFSKDEKVEKSQNRSDYSEVDSALSDSSSSDNSLYNNYVYEKKYENNADKEPLFSFVTLDEALSKNKSSAEKISQIDSEKQIDSKVQNSSKTENNSKTVLENNETDTKIEAEKTFVKKNKRKHI